MNIKLQDFSGATVAMKPLIIKMEHHLENKDFVQALECLIELRQETSDLKSWLLFEISKQKD